ncbi:MAG TPA: threonine-phosphate decarboxylase [Thiothrix sp.]|nr:threonine-phosphate decarboxylase [Thiothrix sp.]
MSTKHTQHGGQLRTASERYRIPLADWLDLSTGINPQSYPIPKCLPQSCWQRLPEYDDGLEQAAANYYGSAELLAVAGSQSAIDTLPSLFSAPKKIGVLSPAYASHASAWHKAGHRIIPLALSEIEQNLATIDVLVLVNPVNPTTHLFPRKQLLRWHQQLQQRNAWLVIDEAFIDTRAEHSLMQTAAQKNLIVLRSIGKFFGLAGIRLGFVWAEQAIRVALAEQQHDWAISHPARWVAKYALHDKAWQQQQRQQLPQSAQRLQGLLQTYLPKTSANTIIASEIKRSDLFVYCTCPLASVADHYAIQLAQQGILIRAFSEPPALRFGLPATAAEWQRLEQALEQIQPFTSS